MPNGYAGVQGGVLFGYRPGSTSAGGIAGNGAFFQDLERERQAEAFRNQKELQAQQFGFGQQDDNAARAFQAAEAQRNRDLQASLQAGNLNFQGQQGFDDRQLRRDLQGQQIGFQGNQAGLDRTFQRQQADANRGFQASESAADRAFRGVQSDADRYFQAAQAGFDRSFRAGEGAAERSLRAGEGAADRQTQLSLGNLSADTARRGQDVTAEGNQLQFRASQLPFDFRRELLGRTEGDYRDSLQAINDPNGFASYLSGVGGQAPALPGLPSSEVFSGDQVNQQVNAARAQGDQGAAEQTRQSQQRLAAQGFGSRSPIQAALQQQILTGAGASNADQERQIRLDAAQANAQQGLSVGSLANQQYQLNNDQDIRRRQFAAGVRNQDIGNRSGLLSLILGLG